MANMMELDIRLLTPTGSMWNYSNETSPPENIHTPPYWNKTTTIILAVFMVIFMVCSIFGNAMVIAVVMRHRGMRTKTNAFLVNLAIGDFMTGVLCMPISLTTVIKGNWIFGDILCQFNGFMVPFLLIASLHSLMYICIHKCISITDPFTSGQIMTKVRIGILIGAVWFWAALSAFLTVYGLNSVSYKPYTTQCGPQYPNKEEPWTYVHVAFINTTCYFIPLLTIIVGYVRIFHLIRKHTRRLQTTSSEREDQLLAQQKHITMTLILMVICFILCWTPYIIYATYMSAIPDKNKIPHNFNAIAYWFGYMNSACNPILYAIRSQSFREGYKEILLRRRAHITGDGTICEDSPGPLQRLTVLLSSIRRTESRGSLHGSQGSISNFNSRNSLHSASSSKVKVNSSGSALLLAAASDSGRSSPATLPRNYKRSPVYYPPGVTPPSQESHPLLQNYHPNEDDSAHVMIMQDANGKETMAKYWSYDPGESCDCGESCDHASRSHDLQESGDLSEKPCDTVIEKNRTKTCSKNSLTASNNSLGKGFSVGPFRRSVSPNNPKQTGAPLRSISKDQISVLVPVENRDKEPILKSNLTGSDKNKSSENHSENEDEGDNVANMSKSEDELDRIAHVHIPSFGRFTSDTRMSRRISQSLGRLSRNRSSSMVTGSHVTLPHGNLHPRKVSFIRFDTEIQQRLPKHLRGSLPHIENGAGEPDTVNHHGSMGAILDVGSPPKEKPASSQDMNKSRSESNITELD